MAAEVAAARIRPAISADLNGVVAIERTSFSDPPWSRAAFASLIGDPQGQFLVAIIEDPPQDTVAGLPGSAALRSTVAGYVVTWVAADEGDLSNLAVAPQMRRRGLGGRLLNAAIDSARAAGVRVLYLEVRESNAIALSLYASRRFVAVGRRQRYYRQPIEDALILCLDVSSPSGA